MILKRPEFYDIFGIGVFGFITATAFYVLWTGNSFPEWAVPILLFIGIAGLAVDGTIVYKTFLRKK